MMKANGKLVRDHRIALNLNHYEYQLIEAYSQLLGVDKSVFARQVLLNNLRTMMLRQDRIALVLPGTGTIQCPLSYSLVPQNGAAAHV